MLLQVASDYPGLPDVRTLRMSEIRYFYEGLRPNLRRHTRPRKTPAGPPVPKPPKPRR